MSSLVLARRQVWLAQSGLADQEQAIKTRFARVLESEDAVLAAVTLPKFRLRWLCDQERKDQAKASLVAECRKHVLEQEQQPGYVPKPTEPSALFDTSPPKLSEIRQVIQQARSASAPGPNGIPYKLYKNCPRVLKLLWTLMRTAWTKLIIPSEWRRAVAVFIPKEQNSKTIGQFRSIALLNVEGKIFFSDSE
ncbi:hypothetical protein SKAU_G00070140 [Synaphobranchus kaupii]|uniref:Reverse transcriptase n=1 Tax=Synaphobranchus kaupii TaxID=118154 RepID=A0A9Q1G7Q6_SYNKA|nr:hypothetical protein SKAU_G00070140 [Synaphobranchus kaupii]